jgi:hypothetical protein
VDVDLAAEVLDVALDCAQAAAKGRRNLAVGMARRDETSYL